MNRHLADDRGSIPVETVILVPAIAMFLLVLILAGRIALARTAVESAAADAARSASIARTPSEARSAAARTAASSLANQQVPCRRTSVAVDTSGFNIPVGAPASVSVTVACDVDVSGLAGLPGGLPNYRAEYSMTSPLDTFRGRR